MLFWKQKTYPMHNTQKCRTPHPIYHIDPFALPIQRWCLQKPGFSEGASFKAENYQKDRNLSPTWFENLAISSLHNTLEDQSAAHEWSTCNTRNHVTSKFLYRRMHFENHTNKIPHISNVKIKSFETNSNKRLRASTPGCAPTTKPTQYPPSGHKNVISEEKRTHKHIFH